jgi:hypothetical protein
MQAYTSSLDSLDFPERLAGLRAITLAVGRIAILKHVRTIAEKNLAAARKLEQILTSYAEEQDSLSPPPEDQLFLYFCSNDLCFLIYYTGAPFASGGVPAAEESTPKGHGG